MSPFIWNAFLFVFLAIATPLAVLAMFDIALSAFCMAVDAFGGGRNAAEDDAESVHVESKRKEQAVDRPSLTCFSFRPFRVALACVVLALILFGAISKSIKYKPVGAPVQTINTQSYTLSFVACSFGDCMLFRGDQYVLMPDSSVFSSKTIRFPTAVCDIKPLDAEHPTPCVEVFESDKAGFAGCEEKYYEMYVDNDTYQSIGSYFSLTEATV